MRWFGLVWFGFGVQLAGCTEETVNAPTFEEQAKIAAELDELQYVRCGSAALSRSAPSPRHSWLKASRPIRSWWLRALW